MLIIGWQTKFFSFLFTFCWALIPEVGMWRRIVQYQYIWVASHEKVPQVLSRCHTKRGIANSSFGMTLTFLFIYLFIYLFFNLFYFSQCQTSFGTVTTTRDFRKLFVWWCPNKDVKRHSPISIHLSMFAYSVPWRNMKKWRQRVNMFYR